jgi:apolipoprotein D and lipocalin family protein
MPRWLLVAAAATSVLGFAAVVYKTGSSRSFRGAQDSLQAKRRPVESLETAAYLGKWYEIARKPQKFQDDPVWGKNGRRFGPGYAATAEYTALSATRLKVVNSQKRDSTAFGLPRVTETSSVEGVATSKRADSARLEVYFMPAWLRPAFELFGAGGEYWVYALGKKNSDGLYAWSLVSDSRGSNLWLLARETEVGEDVLKLVEEVCARQRLPYDRLEFTRTPK